MPWRLLLSPPNVGSVNMALDDALRQRAAMTGESVLRVYSWAEPTLSLGRNERARGHYEPLRLRERRVTAVRRPTGGRALLHWREVTYSVTAPERSDEPLGRSYDRVNRLLLDALRRLGVEATLAVSPTRTPRPNGATCFDVPSSGEITVGGLKLVGSAQVREQNAFLQHGSILVEDDQRLLAALATGSVAPPAPAATLRAALGRSPEAEEVAAALFAAVRAIEDPEASLLVVDEDTLGRARLAERCFRDAAWTWRR